MDNPNNINPIWDIVLYANNLFILYWTNPKIEPIMKDNILEIIKVFDQDNPTQLSLYV